MSTFDLATAAAAVSDPTTPAADLAAIAADFPGLRSQVASHPNAYPGLLDWLVAQGDQTVTAIVGARRVGLPRPPTSPGASANSAVTMPSFSPAPVKKKRGKIIAIVTIVGVVVVAVVVTCLVVFLPKPVDPNGPVLSDAQIDQVLNSQTMTAWLSSGTSWSPAKPSGETDTACADFGESSGSPTDTWNVVGWSSPAARTGLVDAGRYAYAARSCQSVADVMRNHTSLFIGDAGLIGFIPPDSTGGWSVTFIYGNAAMDVRATYDGTASASLDDVMKAAFNGRTSEDFMNDLVTTMNNVAAGKPA